MGNITDVRFVASFVRKLGFVVFLLVVAIGSAVAQNQPPGPPAFVTLPRHAGMENSATDSSHPVPFRLELRNEMFEMVGGLAPGGGRGNGGGKNGGSPAADFGQNGAVAMVPDCFLNSPNNFDATCAEASYQGEPMLAANVLLGRLMGASNDIYPGNCSASAAPGTFGDCGLGALVSSNGINWQRFKLTRNWSGLNFLVGFDPSVAVDSAGRAFVAYGVYDPATGNDGLAAVTSADGGLTWTKTNPVVIDQHVFIFEDKPWIAADANPLSRFKDRLYIAWDRNQGCGMFCTNQILLVSSSSDQGKTWTTPVKINDGTSDSERVIFAFPAVGPDGTVHALWFDYAKQIIFMDKSTDGGLTWGTDVAVAPVNITFPTITCNGGRFVSPAPQMAIDASGNLYVVFAQNSDKRNKFATLDVYITKSTDGGTTWSAPHRVSSVSTTSHRYHPAIGIDSLGRVNVSYLDRRDDPNNCRTNTYLSQSTDGGATFADSRVTDVDSDFDGNKNGPGDYQGLACWGAVAFPFFSDHRDSNATNDNTTGFIDGGFEIYSGHKP